MKIIQAATSNTDPIDYSLKAFKDMVRDTISAVIVDLGDGTVGIVFEDDGELALLQTDDQALVFGTAMQIAEYVDSTWQ